MINAVNAGLGVTSSFTGTQLQLPDKDFFVAKILTKEKIMVDDPSFFRINPDDAVPVEMYAYGWALTVPTNSMTGYAEFDGKSEGKVNAPDNILVNPAIVTGSGQVSLDDFVFMRYRGWGRISYRFPLFAEETTEVETQLFEIISKFSGSAISSVQCVGNQLYVTYQVP